MIDAFIFSGFVIFLYMNALFALASIKKDNSIIDIGWGLGFVVVAWTTLLAFGELSTRQAIATALVTAWGLRLAIHIYLRNKGKDEDWRYQDMRKKWGKWAIVYAYFKVFMLQGALMWIVSLPIVHINSVAANGRSWLIGLGVLLWVFGFFMETVADYHLTQHINDSKKKGLLTTGVWAYTRHPNYFGEAVQWWGIGLIALAAVTTWNPLELTECGWWVLIGPLAITILVRFVSGVPLLEKKYDERNTKEWQKYKKGTPIFIPKLWRNKS